MEALSLRFGQVAQALADEARSLGLRPPAFRSPPRLEEVNRSITRRRDGSTTIAVALRNRPWGAVLADMVDGVVVSNRLRGVTADRCRNALWSRLADIGEQAA